MPDWANESVFATVKMLYEKEDSLEMLNDEFVKLKRGNFSEKFSIISFNFYT